MLTVGRPSWRILASFILREPFDTNFLDYRFQFCANVAELV